MFIPAEGGSDKYFSRDRIICKTCLFSLDKKACCAKRYSEEIILPQQSANVPMPESLKNTTGLMREEILEAGFDLGEDACRHEVGKKM